ncbi:MAG TPA: hypothetical protein VLY63_24270 [Anaerolineae bacterium]|nr:hypothetical protein [Anaerolineae bacterium]
MSRQEELSMRTPGRPSVYTLTDRQLADEYRKLTGAFVEVPSSRNPVAWWQWRCDLQDRVKWERQRKERLAWPQW